MHPRLSFPTCAQQASNELCALSWRRQARFRTQLRRLFSAYQCEETKLEASARGNGTNHERWVVRELFASAPRSFREGLDLRDVPAPSRTRLDVR